MKKLLTNLKVTLLTLILLFSFSVKTSAKTFKDLASKHWAYSAVNEMSNLGVIDGYTDGTFKPSNHVTRAEFAKLIVTTLGLSEEKNTNPLFYEDIKESSWCYEYVKQAGNYLTGYKQSNKMYFYPNKDAVREDMAVAVVTASGLSNVDYNVTTLNKFSDISKASESAKKYIAIAVEHGLMNGNANGTFNPKGTLTRAEAAQLMLNFNKSEKVNLADLDKNKKQDDAKPVLFEQYGYIDLGNNYSKYEYSDNGIWYKATSRYLHKSSNKNPGTCNNFYYTDIQIREANNTKKVYSFKVPYVSLIRVKYDSKTNTVDLGENWHAYDILSSNESDLSKATKGSYKWIKAPDRYIVKGEEYFDKDYLYVRFEEKDKSSFTSEVFKYSDGTNGLTWNTTSKTIEWKNSGYKITNDNGKTYLTVGTGLRSTSGYSIEIKDVKISGYSITVTTQETVPAKGAVTTKGSYYPTATIELSAKPDKVTIKKLANISSAREALTWKETTKQIEYKSSSYKITEEDGKVYLTVGTGSRSTSGYSIKITNVEIDGYNITVTTQETVPGKGASVTKGTNYPTATIELSAKPDKVTRIKLENKSEGGQALTWKQTTKQIEYKSSSYKITEEDGKVYLTVGLGSRTTSGYSIAITDVEVSGYEIKVTTQETVPGKGASVTKGTNYPTATIELSAKPDKVTLNRLDKISAGGQPLTWKETTKQIEYKNASYKITESSGKVYLTVGLGLRPTTGYKVEIIDVKISDYNITVTIQESTPSSSDKVTKTSTYPTATIELSAKPDKVTINKADIKYEGVDPITWKHTDKEIEYRGTSYRVTEVDGKIYLQYGLGKKETDGYKISITDVKVKGKDLTVTVQETRPGKGQKTNSIVNYPVATIELSDRPENVTINQLPVISKDLKLTWKLSTENFGYSLSSYEIVEEKEKTYLVIGIGKRNSTGYSVDVTDVTINGYDMTVTIQERTPAKGALTRTGTWWPQATIELSAKPDNVTIKKLAAKQADRLPLAWAETSEYYEVKTKNYKITQVGGDWPKCYLSVGTGPRKELDYSLKITDIKFDGYNATVYAQEYTPPADKTPIMLTTYPSATVELSAVPDKVTVVYADPIQTPSDTSLRCTKVSNRKDPYTSDGYKIIEENGELYLVVGVGNKPYQFTLGNKSATVDGDNLTIKTYEIVDYYYESDGNYSSTVTYKLTKRPNKITWNHETLQLPKSNKSLSWSEINYPGVTFSDKGGYSIVNNSDGVKVVISPGKMKYYQLFRVFEASRVDDTLYINVIRCEQSNLAPSYPLSTAVKVDFVPKNVVVNWYVD